MSDILSLVRTSIKLDGYGASDRFIGYFEESIKYQPGMADTAADFFLKHYQAYLHDIAVASSLHINSDDFCTSKNAAENEHDLKLIQPLASAGWIPALSYKKTFGDDYESPEHGAAIEKMRNNLKLSRVDEYNPIDFRNLLISPMIVYGLMGHCFLVFEKLGLAFYPHDYRGFGIVALSDDADLASAHDFLTKAGDLEGYFSVLEK